MSGSARLVKAKDQVRMPWKNGGGVTTEIAAFPPGASLDTFDWRISTALVSADGPFSNFPCIDRTLAILSGNGMQLIVGQAAPRNLTIESAPHAFPADVPTHAVLLDGPITDLNVMARRGRWQQKVERVTISGSRKISQTGAACIYCHSGVITAKFQDATIEASVGDVITFDQASCCVSTDTTATLFLVTFESLHGTR